MLSLHSHSTYSALDGIGMPDDIVRRCVELGRKAVCLTEHDNVFSHPLLQKSCREHGVKPIFGCEMRVVWSLDKMREEKQRRKYHLTVIAKTYEGYQNLMKLITFSYNTGFYYKPTIDLATLRDHSKGLVVLSGCMSSMLSDMLFKDEIARASQYTKRMKEIFGDDFYIEIMPHEMQEQKYLHPYSLALAKKHDIRMVLTNDEHHQHKDQWKARQILHAIRDRRQLEPNEEFIDSLYLMTDDEAWDVSIKNMGNFFEESDIFDMFNAQEDIASDCNVEIPLASEVSFPGVDNAYSALRDLVVQGLDYRGVRNKKRYIDRVSTELDLIRTKNFADYFLIVSDIVNWSKGKNILVGPGRGSVGGSVISWLLGIIEIDPLKHGLILERFLSEDRKDLPDIDIDFEDTRRAEVIDYIHNRFQRDNVGHLSTEVSFKGRNTLAEIGKVFGIPRSDIEKVQNVLVTRGSADARASFTISDTFEQFGAAKEVSEAYPDILKAELLEGNIRHFGVHAAGVVINSGPLTNHTALMNRDGFNITQITGETYQALGVLKFDVLGLNYLSIMHDMADEVGMDFNDIYGMPLNDPETLESFNHNCTGIFQFDKASTRSVARQLGVQNFGHIALATSLSRPGPLHSTQTVKIVEAKNVGGAKKWDIDLMNNITSDTFGYVVFQEQVIRIMHEMGGMDWADVSKVRNAMSKSLGDEYFNKYREMFIEGAGEIWNIPAGDANDIFDHTAHFGSYAFNLAHAVEYSVISYWTAWFKTHHPRLFYKTLLNHTDNDDVIRKYLREFLEKGYGRVLPPKLNRSGLKWVVDGDDLRTGLTSVLPQGASEIIVDLYPIESLEDLSSRLPDKRRVNSRVVNKIISEKMLEDDEDIDSFGLYEFAERMTRISERTHQIGRLGYDFNFRNVIVAGVMDRQINLKSIQELKETVKLADWTKRFDESQGDEWAIIYLVDETGGPVNVHIKNYMYPEVKDMLWSKKTNEDILVVRGLIPPSMNYVIAKEIWTHNDNKAPKAKCYSCPLLYNEFCSSQKPDSGKTSIAFVGMNPSFKEIEEQIPLVGPSGRIFNDVLGELGINRNDVLVTNSALCRNTDEFGKNMDPDELTLDSCKDRLFDEISESGAKVVVTLGKLAYFALTGNEISVTKESGQIASVDLKLDNGKIHNVTVVPTFHPAYALYGSPEQRRQTMKEAFEIAAKQAGMDISSGIAIAAD